MLKHPVGFYLLQQCLRSEQAEVSVDFGTTPGLTSSWAFRSGTTVLLVAFRSADV